MRAGTLKQLVSIEKLNHAVSAGWQGHGEAFYCRITEQGDSGEGMRRYTVEARWSQTLAEMMGLQSLGYGFRLLWTDPGGVARELDVDSVTLPTERIWSEPVVLQCHAATKET